MVYRIAGGIGLTLLGLATFGLAIPAAITGIALVIGGVALLGGF